MASLGAREDLIRRFSELRVANVSDALNVFGIDGGCHGIRPVYTPVRMVGSAYTARYVPCGGIRGTVGDFLDQVDPGDVVVIDNQGSVDCTVWGYLLTVAGKQKGIAGAVVEGACRDVSIITEERFPVFARDAFLMTGKDRVMLESTQVPVSIGRVSVYPEDIILGDESGVVVVPLGLALQVLQEAAEIKSSEDRAAEAIRRGMPIKEAREMVGYHRLQSRRRP